VPHTSRSLRCVGFFCDYTGSRSKPLALKAKRAQTMGRIRGREPTHSHKTRMSGAPGSLSYAAFFFCTAVAAFRITSRTNSGWDNIGTWLLSVSKVVAPIRFATKRSNSGWIVRSFVATMYQLGFDFHAVPSTFCWNKSATGAPCVAQISCCSSSERSPAKDGTCSAPFQTRHKGPCLK